MSVERGVDPRRCVLVAFGGGGPLHACALAELLGVRRVLVPPFAGVLSALGLAIAPERRDAMASVMRAAKDLDGAATRELDAVLVARAEGGRGGGAGHVQRWMRARYEGQGHELEIPFAPGEAGDVLASRFGAEHEKRMGFTLEQGVEIIGARVAITGDARSPNLVSSGDAAATHRGPAVVALPDATMLVAEGWTARTLPIGGYLVEHNA